MSKSLTRFGDRQAQRAVGRPMVELLVPLLAILEDTQSVFFGLCVTAGTRMLEAMMEADRTALCGAAAIALRRLRVRSLADGELVLPSFTAAAATSDPLDRHTPEAIAAGVSMRRYGRSLDPLPPAECEYATKRSAVSRRFAALTEAKLAAWFTAPLGELDPCAVMSTAACSGSTGCPSRSALIPTDGSVRWSFARGRRRTLEWGRRCSVS